MSDQDWRRLALRSSELADAPLFIDDSPNLTMMEIRAKARRLAQRHDLQLIIIDYLQLMTSGKRVESRQQEVSEFSRAMKLLAKELNVPVVALSQLNRGPEQRTDKKPMLSDLRESGSIEQDSDLVLLVHRPDLYEPETERAGEADLIIAKHRNGPTSTVAVAFQGRYSRFADMPQLVRTPRQPDGGHEIAGPRSACVTCPGRWARPGRQLQQQRLTRRRGHRRVVDVADRPGHDRGGTHVTDRRCGTPSAWHIAGLGEVQQAREPFPRPRGGEPAPGERDRGARTRRTGGSLRVMDLRLPDDSRD